MLQHIVGNPVLDAPWSPQTVLELQRTAGNAVASSMLGTRQSIQRDDNATPADRSTTPKPMTHVPWTGDPVTMASAMRDLLLTQQTERIALSLGMLWIRGMVDTMRMLKLDPGVFAAITTSGPFTRNPRLTAALDVVEGRAPPAGLVPEDQAVELRAMHDVPDWPRIIGPQAPRRYVELRNPDTLSYVGPIPPSGPVAAPKPAVASDKDVTSDPILDDPRYYAALYDAIRRNRAMAGQYALRSVKARPEDRVPGGYIYVGPSHKGDKPGGLEVDDAKQKEVNEAIWKELGVGEGTQASINTWDTAKFSFGPGFAATGLLRQVMDNLAKSDSTVLAQLRNAGLVYEKNTWYVVDPDTQSVKRGPAALEVLSKDVGLISTFLDTAGDPAMRRSWMEAEWQAMGGPGGAAAVPPQVVQKWPVELIVFVAHCVHWAPKVSWKHWDTPDPPSVFEVVRTYAPLVSSQTDDPRILTLLSARTFRGFSGGLLLKTMKERGRRHDWEVNLPDGWKSAFAGAVALPASATTPTFHIIEADEK